MNSRLSRSPVMVLALFLVFALTACSGGTFSETAPEVQIFAVAVSDDGSTATMAVSFGLSDGGTALSGIDPNDVRFTVAKLIPAASPSAWQSYINRLDGSAVQATYERANTASGVFTDNGDGTYSYKFSFNFRAVTAPAAVTYQQSLTHRIAMQVSGNANNATYDFVPANQNAALYTRNIVDNVSCSECHEPFGFHGGGRIAIKYCVTCHNPGTTDESSGNIVDFKVMVHKIHRGEDVPGGPYIISGHDYSTVVFPQDILNCTKCHDNTNAATPDADNWKNMPGTEACTACHAAQPVPGFPDLTAAEIETAHVTPNATPHNPDLPAGVPNIEYELLEATVDGSDHAVITFRILRDGVPLDLLNLEADLAGPGRWPDFYLGYALSRDGIAEPAEYNNQGISAGQEIRVNLEKLGPVDTTEGTMVNDGGNTFTATTVATFPAGATLRAVGLGGYFRIDLDPFAPPAYDYSLHTPSKVIAVTGDDARREVVDSSKCGSCHEWVEGHGGNRVFNVQICVFCHNPSLTSPNRTEDPPIIPDFSDKVQEAIDDGVIDAGIIDPLNRQTYPEVPFNFKDMIHSIHGGEARTMDYVLIEEDSITNFTEEVLFPGRAGNCLTCHKPGTYEVPLVDDTLPTTSRITGVDGGIDADAAAVETARDTMPNDTDWVITPTAAACYACHNSPLAQSHMEVNGAIFNDNRNDVVAAGSIETCSLCHGPGKTADLAVVHAASASTRIGTIAPPESSDSGGGLSEVDLCAPGPISAQPAGHTDNLSCCSCHS